MPRLEAPTKQEMAEACRRAAKRIRENPERWTRRKWIEYGQYGRDLAGVSDAPACMLGNVIIELYPNLKIETLARSIERHNFVRAWLNGEAVGYNDSPVSNVEDVAAHLEFEADRLSGLVKGRSPIIKRYYEYLNRQ